MADRIGRHLLVLTVVPGADVAGNRFVNFDGELPGAGEDGDKAFGVNLHTVKNGQPADVVTRGTEMVEANETLTVGTAVAMNGSADATEAGRARTAAGGDKINGYVIEGGDEGDLVEVLLV